MSICCTVNDVLYIHVHVWRHAECVTTWCICDDMVYVWRHGVCVTTWCTCDGMVYVWRHAVPVVTYFTRDDMLYLWWHILRVTTCCSCDDMRYVWRHAKCVMYHISSCRRYVNATRKHCHDIERAFRDDVTLTFCLWWICQQSSQICDNSRGLTTLSAANTFCLPGLFVDDFPPIRNIQYLVNLFTQSDVITP